jgi:hypothetical protein
VTSRLAFVLAAMLLAVAAGCGSHKDSVGTTTTETSASLFTGSTRPVSFDAVRSSILALYSSEPAIRSFAYKDVVYTPEARDKVLTVCRRGGPTINARELETSRVFGCAPLIFFFYSYGTRKNVPASMDIARSLYRYAADIKGPYDPQPQLRSLLRSWGVQ